MDKAKAREIYENEPHHSPKWEEAVKCLRENGAECECCGYSGGGKCPCCQRRYAIEWYGEALTDEKARSERLLGALEDIHNPPIKIMSGENWMTDLAHRAERLSREAIAQHREGTERTERSEDKKEEKGAT